ncbi:MAG TPA: peptidase S8 [Paenibacillaceae bacterium]|nr:peptidase S8 [Paenibacillaceae bacterium]
MKSRKIWFGALALVVIATVFMLNRPPSGTQIQREKTTKKETIHKVKAPTSKINNIQQVLDARKKLEQSTRIVTIHHNSRDKSHYMKNEVAVKFNKRLSHQELKALSNSVNGEGAIHHDHIYIFKSKNWSSHKLVDFFTKQKNVLFAEPHYLLLPNMVPNDTFYPSYQWNMPIIDMEKAWDISKGKETIKVAVIDTGVELNHPEFKGKLTSGYNVLSGSSNANDDNGHGTHVTGIIAAHINNKEGIAGMTWYNPVIPIKGIGADGSGSSFDIAKGIKWATDHGAKVINLSVGNYNPSEVLHDAIKYAYTKDVVMIAATGNDDTSQPSYPASYPEVIGVSAVDGNKKRASFSNYGSSVDVVAPGVDIPSTYTNQEYAQLSGTSMACPHVTGLATLIRSVNPSLKNEQVMSIIKYSSQDLGTAGRDDYYGYGLINVSKALELAKAGYVQQSSRHTPPVRNKGFFQQLRERFFSQLFE